MIYCNKIPRDYFMAFGKGQGNIGESGNSCETGVFDIALRDAGIADFNIMQYTSVLPKESAEHKRRALKPLFERGSVADCIMASMNGNRWDQITAGIGRIWVKDAENGQIIGGFAARFEGKAPARDAERILLDESLPGIYSRQYGGDERYEPMYPTAKAISMRVTEQYGTVLAAIVFMTCSIPTLKDTSLLLSERLTHL